jgi:hypothetical protein
MAVGTNPPAAAVTPPVPPAKIQFDKTVYDFGTTSLVDSVTGTFTFHNVGTGDLKLGKPQPSCGCTVASVKPDLLKPGEKGELVFTVHVGGMRGHLEKSIKVLSNDPQNSSVSLGIKVEMKQIVEVTPSSFNIGNLRQGETTNLSVVLRRTDVQKLVIAKVEPSSKMLSARVEPVEASNGQSVTLLIDVRPEGAPHGFNDNVKAYLDGVSQPVATINVSGHLLGDVLLDLERLYWPVMGSTNAQTETPPERRIKVTSARTNQPLEITNLTTSLTNLTVELVTVETGKEYTVIAKFAETPQRSESGTISFNTNTSLQPTVTIPVTVVVLRK